jgi:hypothetical protein
MLVGGGQSKSTHAQGLALLECTSALHAGKFLISNEPEK